MLKKDKLINLSQIMHSRFIETWEELAETGGDDKSKTLVISDYPHTKNSCFACEFIQIMGKITGKNFFECYKVCPIQWISQLKLKEKPKQKQTCQMPESLYQKWCEEKNIEEKKKIALKISKLEWNNKFIRILNL